jgi:hypothetical protein
MREQMGDVVREVDRPVGPLIWRRRTRQSVAVSVVSLALFAISLWFWKVAGERQVAQLTLLAMFVVQILSGRSQVEEHWPRPRLAEHRSALRRLQLLYWALAASVIAILMCLVFFAPDRSVIVWAGCLALIGAWEAAMHSINKAIRRLLVEIAARRAAEAT